MKILQVNKYHYPKGGADKYYLNLSNKLESSNFKVANFSMHHPKNIDSRWSKYFISQIEFNSSSLKDKLKTPGRIIYSLEAKNKFEKLINDFKPDIVHLHNIYHQISPSILTITKKYKIPTVIHLHDYKLICPNYQLFVNNSVCQACKQKKYYKCFLKKCVKNSYSKSALATLEMYIHHFILNIYQNNIDKLISPSQFLKNKFVEFGWPAEKISVLCNPFDSSLRSKKNLETKDYLLYFGRLSKEKGIHILLDAIKNSQENLKIIGTGSIENQLKKIAKINNLKIEFLGYKQGDDLADIISQAKAVIIPSIWWENMPLNMLEALNLGRPVIASYTGGIPEIINEGKNGLLFKTGSAKDLKEKIAKLHKLNLNKLSINAKESVKHLSEDKNFEKIKSIYKTLI